MKNKMKSYVCRYVDFLLARQKALPFVNRQGITKQTIFTAFIAMIVFVAVAYLLRIETSFVYVVFSANTILFGSFLLYRIASEIRVKTLMKEPYSICRMVLEDSLYFLRNILIVNAIILFVFFQHDFPILVNLILVFIASIVTIYIYIIKQTQNNEDGKTIEQRQWFFSLVFTGVMFACSILIFSIPNQIWSYLISFTTTTLFYLLKPLATVNLDFRKDKIGAYSWMMLVIAFTIFLSKFLVLVSRPDVLEGNPLYTWKTNVSNTITLEKNETFFGLYLLGENTCIATSSHVLMLNSDGEIEQSLPVPDGIQGYFNGGRDLYYAVSDPSLAISSTTDEERSQLVSVYHLSQEGESTRIVGMINTGLSPFTKSNISESDFYTIVNGQVAHLRIDRYLGLILETYTDKPSHELDAYSFSVETMTPSVESGNVMIAQNTDFLLYKENSAYVALTYHVNKGTYVYYNHGLIASTPSRNWMRISLFVDGAADFSTLRTYSDVDDSLRGYLFLRDMDYLMFEDSIQIYDTIHTKSYQLDVSYDEICISGEVIAEYDETENVLSLLNTQHPSDYVMTGSNYLASPVLCIFVLGFFLLVDRNLSHFQLEVKS